LYQIGTTMNKNNSIIFVLLFVLFPKNTIAQNFNSTEIDNINTNKTASEGDLYLDTDKNLIYLGLQSGLLHSLSNWQVNGNNNLTNSSFLGHINDVKLQFRSNNLPIIEMGRRQTLGLTQNYPFYTDNNQPLVHINGNGTTSALQFASSGANFYKPMFFTTTNGSFRLKGSSGRTDLFEIGSAGPSNDGRLEFIIGDDGREPMVFKRYDYRNGQFYKELFRVQGHENSANAKTRFGININTQHIPVANDADYNQSNAGYNIANSTFQVNGSVSKSILKTTGNLTLTEDHHTIIVNGNHLLTLPNANSCIGRIYVIKNPTNNAIIISSYLANNGASVSTINNNSVVWLQSDGSNWQNINATSTGSSTPATLVDNGDGTYTFSNGVDPNVTIGSGTVTPPPPATQIISNFQTTNMSYMVATGTLSKGNQGTGLAYTNGSQAVIESNETGSFEFRMVNVNNQRLSIGLDANSANPTNWNSIDYSFYIDNGNTQIVSNGSNTNWLNPNFNNIDVLRIEKDINNYVHFYRNGVLIYSSSVVATSNLYVQVRFTQNGTQLSDLKIIK